MGKAVLYTESQGAFSSTRSYLVNTDEPKRLIVSESNGSGEYSASFPRGKYAQERSGKGKWIQKIKQALGQIFLPYGFPDSVSSDYINFQIWDTIQAFASSLNGALATEAVMRGVGVGNETATPLAAALTWLLKSGSGHIGQIAFTWAKGTSLDFDCKKWRLFADVVNDIAFFIDLTSPLFSTDVVVIILCSSSVARALVGVSGSATRAAVTQHQARMNNMADVSAKDGSQETLVNLLALVTSLVLLPLVSGKTLIVWTLFVLFTSIHLYANYKAVKALELEAFNRSRLLLCLQEYIDYGSVSTVKKINNMESVFLGLGIKSVDICGFEIKMGAPLIKSLNEDQIRPLYIEKLVGNFNPKPFLIIPVLDCDTIYVTIHENISAAEIIEAFVRSVFTGIVIHQIRSKVKNNSTVCLSLSSIATTIGDACTVNPMDRIITKEWENFQRLAKLQGFAFDRHLLETDGWRAKWKHA